ESRRATAVHRRRNQRGHSARRRNEGIEDDRRDQQQSGSAHFPDRRLRSGRRSLQGAARAARGDQGLQVESAPSPPPVRNFISVSWLALLRRELSAEILPALDLIRCGFVGS